MDFTELVCLGGGGGGGGWGGFLHTSTDLVFIADTPQQETVHHGKEGRGGEQSGKGRRCLAPWEH